MSSPNPSFVSQEEFKAFYSIDRLLYTILTINLWKDASEAMNVMALLIWLEKVGFGPVVYRILAFPHAKIGKLMDEVVMCLRSIKYGMFASYPDVNIEDIPLLRSVVQKEINVAFFLQNNLTVKEGVSKVLNEVCRRAFEDIKPITFGTLGSAPLSILGNSNEQPNLVFSYRQRQGGRQPNVSLVEPGSGQAVVQSANPGGPMYVTPRYSAEAGPNSRPTRP